MLTTSFRKDVELFCKFWFVHELVSDHFVPLNRTHVANFVSMQDFQHVFIGIFTDLTLIHESSNTRVSFRQRSVIDAKFWLNYHEL